MWHYANAKSQNLNKSVISNAYNEAKAHGFTDPQAYEYIADVAYKHGWSEEGGPDVGRRDKVTQIQVANNARTRDINQLNAEAARRQKAFHTFTTATNMVGTGLKYIPHPLAQTVGTILQVPAISEDTYNAVKNPTVSNIVDASVNALKLPNQVAGGLDDAARALGIAYDAIDLTTGSTLAEHLENKIKKKSLKTTTPTN